MTANSKNAPGSIPIESIQWGSSWPELASDDDRRGRLLCLEDRFGIPMDTFDDYLLFKRKNSWHLLKNSPGLASFTQLKVSRLGLKAFQKVGAFVKPTTRIIQAFGHKATKALIDIDQKQLIHLLTGNDLNVNLDKEKGYVILRLGTEMILGLGFYADGKVRSQLPKKELRANML